MRCQQGQARRTICLLEGRCQVAFVSGGRAPSDSQPLRIAMKGPTRTPLFRKTVRNFVDILAAH